MTTRRRWLWIVVPVAVLISAAPAGAVTTTVDARGQLAVNGAAQFPIGLAAPSSAIPQLSAAGVTFYQYAPPTGVAWSTPLALSDAHAYDHAAASNGAWVWMNLRQDNTAAPWFNITGNELSGVVSALTGDPGLGVWRGAGEPNMHRMDPSRVASPGIDPAHLWATIEAASGTQADLAAYSKLSQINGVDVYPINLKNTAPHLHRVGVWTHTELEASLPNRAIWTTLGVCSAAAHDASGEYIFPTYAQTRFMAWDAIINGARGITFFGADHPNCMSAADKAAGFNWAWWNTAGARVVAELHRWSPEIAGQHAIIQPAKTGTERMRFVAPSDARIVATLNLRTYTVTITR